MEGGSDADIDRFTRLWRYALTPFLRPYVARAHRRATASELRGPFESGSSTTSSSSHSASSDTRGPPRPRSEGGPRPSGSRS